MGKRTSIQQTEKLLGKFKLQNINPYLYVTG